MKKLLFTIQWYPSYKSPNVYCDTNIMNALLATGKYEIHCLVYKPYNRPSEEMLDGFHIHRFKRSWLFDAVMKADAAPDLFKSKLVRKLARLFMRLKQIVFVPIYPIYEPLLVRRFQNEAVELHKREHFDLVVSECSGIETLLAGCAVKKYDGNVKYLPIFWDSLSGGFCPHYLPEKYARKSRRALEKKVMSVADKAIVMESSMEFHKLYANRYEYLKKFIPMNIPYLKDLEINHIPEQMSNRIKAIFSGTLSQRNPKYLFSVLSHIKNMEITFICDKDFHSELHSIASDCNLEIRCLPFMEHEKLLDELRTADLFLNIGVRESNAISGKIFEYMSFGRPIISTYFIDNEACIPFLKKYPLGLMVDERLSVESNVAKVANFLQLHKNQYVDFEIVKNLFPKCLASSYVSIIDDLFNE